MQWETDEEGGYSVLGNQERTACPGWEMLAGCISQSEKTPYLFCCQRLRLRYKFPSDLSKTLPVLNSFYVSYFYSIVIFCSTIIPTVFFSSTKIKVSLG